MATIYDVAKEAGVSIGTVSYVINKSKQVRPITIKKVEAAMQKLNYLPSAHAKALALGRTNVISLVYPSSVIDFQMILNKIPIAIGDVLINSDYRLNLLPLLPGKEIAELEASVQSRLLDGALLLNTLLHDERVEYLKQTEVPFVLIGRCLDNNDLYFIDADIEKAAHLQVEHLSNLGHHQIAFVGLQPEGKNISSVSFRLQTAFINALNQFGLSTNPRLLIKAGCPAEIFNDIEKLLTSANPPTAISVSSEADAMCILKTAAKLGLKIPGDLAIIGYAESPLYPLLSPSITVVFDKIMELGNLATTMLLELLDGKNPEKPHILLEPRLIARESTVGKH